MNKAFIKATKAMIQQYEGSSSKLQSRTDQGMAGASPLCLAEARVGGVSLRQASGGQPARLVWRSVPHASAYEAQANVNPAQSRHWIALGIVEVPEIILADTPLPGLGFWVRVRVLFDGQPSPWSDPLRVQLERESLGEAA